MEVMRRYSNCRIGFAAFLLLVFATGCSDHDKPGENPTVTAPTVSSVAPLDAASGACSSTVVTATFSAAMNPASIDGVTFTLTGPGTAAVAGVVSYSASSNTATFTPTSTLALGTIYTATITTGATDAYGIALASNYVWAFTTGTSPCAPPAVASEIPANAATGVCPATVVTATFSEAMNAATISATTFTLAGPGTTAVAGAVSYAGSTATFTPSSALALNTVYTATITTGAQDPSRERVSRQLRVDFHHEHHGMRCSHCGFGSSCEWSNCHLSQYFIDRDFQRSDAVFHHQRHNVYVDGARNHVRAGNSYIRWVKRCRDL